MFSRQARGHGGPIIAWLTLAALAAGWIGVGRAFELRLTSHMTALAGSGWEARDVEIAMEQRSRVADGPLRVRAGELILSQPLPRLRGVQLDCPRFVMTADRVACHQGRFRVTQTPGGELSGRVDFDYPLTAQDRFEARIDIAPHRGKLALKTSGVRGGDWQAEIFGDMLEAGVVARWLSSIWGEQLRANTVQGTLGLTARLSGRGATLGQARFRLRPRGLVVSSTDGAFKAERLNAGIEGRGRAEEGGWRFSVELEGSEGRLGIRPLSLALSPDRPLRAQLEGRLQRDRLTIRALRFRHPGVVEGEGRLVLDLGDREPLESVELQLTEVIFPAAHSYYVQPFGVESALGQLRTRGRVRGRLAYRRAGLERLELELADLSLDDVRGRYGIEGLSGKLSWGIDSKPRQSTLRWRRGHVYRLDIGPGRLALGLEDGTVRLLRKERIPVLDGALIIERWHGEGLGAGEFRWQFDGVLTPVSMEALSRALGWPALSGKLSGVIPGVRFAEGRLEVGGALLIRIFDGDISITDLRTDKLFGVSPRLHANLEVRNLDLLTLTRAFDFGSIRGKLEGRVQDLRLEDWRVTRFDATFASPAQAQGPRLISQRAVENIAALSGGGMTGALSRGVMGMFEEFRYKRLGIRCRLEQGVCEMDGVAPAGKGFYLVEGGGLPRIDVIGYTRRVDWHDLLSRLRAAARSESPVVR